MDTQIKDSVDSQLAAKGLTKVDGDKADLYVAYQVSVNQEKQWNAYGMVAECVGVAEWPRPKARPLALERWCSICMTQRPNNWFGLDV